MMTRIVSPPDAEAMLGADDGWACLDLHGFAESPTERKLAHLDRARS